jgi:flagellar hook-associated protein 2
MASTGTISSGVGLVTGIPIATLVSELVSLDSGPVNSLTAANSTITSQTTALTALEASLTALQSDATALGQSSLFTANTTNSSSPATLTVKSNGSATAGSYQFTVLQTAQSQEFQSSAFASDTSALGAGSISFQYGGLVNQGVDLSELNGGAGVSSGSIEITDRSGKSATINLAGASTITDVVNDINNNGQIGVKASIVGDQIQLNDITGSTVANLQVQEVNGGKTAADLGLGNVNVAANSATGTSVYYLSGATQLSQLNDGLGIVTDNALPDLQLALADGTTANVTLSQLPVLGSPISGTTNDANVDSQVQFAAIQNGSAYDGVTVSFVDDPSISEGNETVSYDSSDKQLVFHIAQGQTTANDIVTALGANSTVSKLFTASTVSGSNGTGKISASDVALLTGPDSAATTPGTISSNAKLTFTAKTAGSNYDGVQILFVNDPSITAGNETASYDASSKTLTFNINSGGTTANDIIAALKKNAAASAVFGASLSSGSNGSGLVSTSDGVTTTGGAVVEPVAAGQDSTVQDLLNAINSAAPGKVSATISGNKIVVSDLTSGSGTFSIKDLNQSQVATELGLTGAATSGVITGDEVLGDLNSPLLKDLKGGAGLGQLGSITLTDRSGASATVNLASANTLGDVIQAINNAGLGIHASVNAAQTGIQLTDTTGDTTSNLIVADADSAKTAEALGIATNSATTSVNSGSLHLQFINQNTALSNLNGGAGVATGSFQITDTNGVTVKVPITSNVKTIGDVIDAINNSGAAVTASINPNGDGIQIAAIGNGTGTLSVSSGSGGSTASDLHLLNTETAATVNGKNTQVVNGSNVTTIAISSSDTLQSLISNINNAGLNVEAQEFNNGSSTKGYQFTLYNQGLGEESELAVDTSNAGFSLNQIASAQDAKIQFGAAGSGGSIASSSSNNFSNLVPNLTLTAVSASNTPVTVSVSSDSSQLVSAAQQFVSDFNSLFSTISTDTAFNSVTGTGAVLDNDANVTQVQNQVLSLLTGQFAVSGSYTSLANVGFSLSQTGTLSLNTTTLENAYSSDPSDVQNLFSAANNGVSAQFKTLITQLAGPNNSLLSDKITSLNNQQTANQAQIATLNAALNAESARLTSEFDESQLVISQLQANETALNAIFNFNGTSLSSSNSSSSGGSGGSSSTASSDNISGVSSNLGSGLSSGSSTA